MGFIDKFKGKEKPVVESVKSEPLMYVDESQAVKSEHITEMFKGLTDKTDVLFPSELGEEHPFNLETIELIYRKVGFVNGAINKFVDFMVSGFYVTSKDAAAKEIIEQWMQDVGFDSILRKWILEAFVKGTGYVELGEGDDDIIDSIKVLDSKFMFIQRDETGKIEGYKQFIGMTDAFSSTNNEVIDFTTEEVAHFSLNGIGDMAYGLGLIYPAHTIIEDVLQAKNDMYLLMKRKANSPMIVKYVGNKDGTMLPSAGDVNAIGEKMQLMRNNHEWVFGPGIEVETLNFGDIGDKFTFPLEWGMEAFSAALQIPQVLLGKGSIPEGLAKVQMDGFQRNIKAKQAEIEKVIEEKIFRRVLIAQGIDVHVEFEWGQPSAEERNAKLDRITQLLKAPLSSEALRTRLEKELARTFEFGEEEIESMKEEREREENEPQPPVPGQVSQEKQPDVPQKIEEIKEQPIVPKKKKSELLSPLVLAKDYEIHGQEYCGCHEYKSGVDYSLKEWLGFNYTKYQKDIQKFLEKYDFSFLAARDQLDELRGKLSEEKISKLRTVLMNGFEKGESIQQIKRNIMKNVKVPNLLKTQNGVIVKDDKGIPLISKNSKERALLIARTETTRAAAEGAIKSYKSAEIQQVRWVASMSERTCPICLDLNGRIFNINEISGLLPAHVSCRCTYLPITELN
jgi:SPP1 gp7 family putative phage head morphogenesis protein|tara:strand:+ start:2982 stop:5021 length:2040 start_codon:yes stop_codon:yes gene_type:complete